MLHHIVPEGREPSPPVSRYLRPVISVGLRDVRVAPGSGKCRALAFEGGERSVLGQRGSVVLGLPWSRLSLQVGVPCVGLHEKPPEVTCTSRGDPGFPASTRERPRETFFNTSRPRFNYQDRGVFPLPPPVLTLLSGELCHVLFFWQLWVMGFQQARKRGFPVSFRTNSDVQGVAP